MVIGRLAWGSLALALALVTDEIHDRVPPPSPNDLDETLVPRPEVAQAFSLGFDSALADYYWIRAVQIVGSDEAHPKRETLGRIVEVVTQLDPWVDHPYRFAAIWLTDTPESVRLANRILRRGIEYHPDEWRNYFYLGFNLYFYLSRDEEAADVLEQAVALEGSPVYLPRLVARLRTSGGESLDMAVIFLEELIKETQDQASRGQYRAALDEIEVERRARMLDRAREAFRARHGRDIGRVEDLLAGTPPILTGLPDPEPPSIPDSLRQGSIWYLNRKTGRITSNYYGRRYEMSFHAQDAERRARWSALDAQSQESENEIQMETKR